jgi:ABC-2 type transport system permease protein
MRLFSEEFNIGSYETLLTMPVTIRDVILGKFFGAVAFLAIMLLPTLAYPVSISFLGQLDWGPVFGGYIGTMLLGSAFSAIGLFASSLTRSQIVALIIGMTACFSLTLIDKMLFFLPPSLLGLFEYIGADFHFHNISKGIIDSRDILYFLTICFVSIYGTQLIIEQKN